MPDTHQLADTSPKRGKMSEAFDEALAHNAMPTDGREGEQLYSRESDAMSSESVNNAQTATANASANSSSPPASGQGSDSPAENALSTQAEGKMAIGEELRDREFPVPPQKSGAASQRLVVDQETMPDEGPRPGGAVGTMPGDHQNVGGATDIIDQRAKTPDLIQQQR